MTAPTIKDPVCGMTVDPGKATPQADHDGRTYYFCSAGCRAKFLAEPGKYASPAVEAAAHGVAPEALPGGRPYTCPMHPEIRQDGPGDCPICGMALEPVTASADQGPNL